MAALPDKAARPVLGGGTRVTRFPTAIATAPSRRVPVKDRTPPLLGRSAAPWGASGKAPGSGTAELTKLETRPDLERNEIAGWRRRGHRDADARRGARFCPGRWALAHHRDTRSYMAAFIPQWNGIGLRIGTSA